MNIAIFTNNYLPNPFGVAGSIESFRKEFEKLGHTVHVFAPEFENYIDENKNVHRFPSINFTFKKINFPLAIPYSYRMDRILENLEIDVVHCQHPNLLGWAGKRWAKKKNVPLIFTWHTLYDQYAHFAPFFVPKKLAAWWSISNAKRYANVADQVVVPTPSVEKIIRKWGVTNKQITAIPTGVDENEFQNVDRQLVRREYEIQDDQIVITLVSRITAEKNVLFLARVMKKILEKNKKTIFVLAGDGSELDAIKKIFSDEKISNRFRCFGIVDGKTKAGIYGLSDIFVYASKSETQGMVISEALYAGLPVVAVNGTGVKDLVTNQVDGLLVNEDEEEFAKAVERLIDDSQLRKKFSISAKEIARQQYTSNVCAKKMLEVYERAIKERNNKDRKY